MRHGETTWDAQGKFTGWADPHLSNKGRMQCDEAAIALQASGYTFDVAYTSIPPTPSPSPTSLPPYPYP